MLRTQDLTRVTDTVVTVYLKMFSMLFSAFAGITGVTLDTWDPFAVVQVVMVSTLTHTVVHTLGVTMEILPSVRNTNVGVLGNVHIGYGTHTTGIMTDVRKTDLGVPTFTAVDPAHLVVITRVRVTRTSYNMAVVFMRTLRQILFDRDTGAIFGVTGRQSVTKKL